jgi:hypothetical protein
MTCASSAGRSTKYVSTVFGYQPAISGLTAGKSVPNRICSGGTAAIAARVRPAPPRRRQKLAPDQVERFLDALETL